MLKINVDNITLQLLSPTTLNAYWTTKIIDCFILILPLVIHTSVIKRPTFLYLGHYLVSYLIWSSPHGFYLNTYTKTILLPASFCLSVNKEYFICTRNGPLKNQSTTKLRNLQKHLSAYRQLILNSFRPPASNTPAGTQAVSPYTILTTFPRDCFVIILLHFCAIML